MRKGFGDTVELEREGPGGRRKQTLAQQGQHRDVTLAILLESVDVRSGAPAADVRVQQVTNDSRKVQPGALFVAIHGEATDGNLFAKDAASRGALAVLSGTAAPGDREREIPWV